MNALAGVKCCPETMDVAGLVDKALRESGYRDLCGLRCEFVEGAITLTGLVRSFFLKQMAQTIAARVPGVTRINNQLRVA